MIGCCYGTSFKSGIMYHDDDCPVGGKEYRMSVRKIYKKIDKAEKAYDKAKRKYFNTRSALLASLASERISCKEARKA